MRHIILLLALLISLSTHAQDTHTIKGTVIDKGSREPVSYVTVAIRGMNIATQTDSVGGFSIANLKPAAYVLQASSIGYKTTLTPEYLLNGKDIFVSIEIESSSKQLAEISVVASPFRKVIESPVSLHVIGLQEIEKSPGANRDISRIVQAYPGVAFSPVGYRNDLIVRGGGPAENRFFLDGVEIPNINHFSTQGASGGPVGIINADLIREVSFYSGAFPASRGNALSSVLDFKLRDGNPEKRSLKATLGASEFSLTSNGYLSKNTTYLVSARQSYLQFLFSALGLPFLPTYTDAQFKIKTKLSRTHELTFMGLTGIDNMRLNDKATSEDAEYILNYLPKITQETFTLGTVYKHYSKSNTQTVVLSHSYLNNKNIKYKGNDQSTQDNLLLDYKSREQETKLRIENLTSLDKWKINAGASLDHVMYTNTSFQQLFINNSPVMSDYNTDLSFVRWGAFGTLSYNSDDDRFTGSLGVRADAAGYSSKMNNLLDQLSPRLSLSYRLVGNLYASANAERYFQLPALTAMGFKDNNGSYVNKGLRYMKADQISAGLSYRIGRNIELSAESFYKQYKNSPLSVKDSIPLMSKGNDYGVVGNELLVSSAQGRSYGVEFLTRWIIPLKVNVSSSFTLFKSEFKDTPEGKYIPSSWDNGYIFNLSGTYYLPRNWSVGAKIRSIGGSPYTPYDLDKSSLVSAWDVQQRPYFDYSRFNAMRSKSFTQMDIRVDKTFYLKKYMLGFYIDLQNVTGSSFNEQDAYVSTGKIANPEAPADQQRYVMKTLKQSSSTLVPTIGATFEF